MSTFHLSWRSFDHFFNDFKNKTFLRCIKIKTKKVQIFICGNSVGAKNNQILMIKNCVWVKITLNNQTSKSVGVSRAVI